MKLSPTVRLGRFLVGLASFLLPTLLAAVVIHYVPVHSPLRTGLMAVGAIGGLVLACFVLQVEAEEAEKEALRRARRAHFARLAEEEASRPDPRQKGWGG